SALLDPQHLLQGLVVGPRDLELPTELPLLLRRLVLQLVAAHRRQAHDLARPRHLEPLLRGAPRFLLRHLVSLLRFSSGPAPAPCCDRRGEAGTRSARSP